MRAADYAGIRPRSLPALYPALVPTLAAFAPTPAALAPTPAAFTPTLAAFTPDLRALALPLPVIRAVRATSEASRRAVFAACRMRQAIDGLPAMSAAAISRPPNMERFFRK